MRKKSKNQPKMPFYFCKLVVEFSYIYEYIYPYNKNYTQNLSMDLTI